NPRGSPIDPGAIVSARRPSRNGDGHLVQSEPVPIFVRAAQDEPEAGQESEDVPFGRSKQATPRPSSTRQKVPESSRSGPRTSRNGSLVPSGRSNVGAPPSGPSRSTVKLGQA